MNSDGSKQPVIKITIEPPDTPENFHGYNFLCSSLDSDYLTQPINEAEYDSETQACVDIRSGKHSTFYDHYRRKPKLKKGLHVGPETPMPRPVRDGDSLAPPTLPGLPTTTVPRSVLQDPVARRLATGTLPRK
ncbi:hypothetical protein DQ04_03361070 [Trypanosoma grayi]|uniref:hypothetical protein n=1 Tax=Trypanosoma grayi TaxID=71804 RepID=UPI0004F44537|nr:hypothetical protein DQ04_03361070 [Trypanosoma grayi]KEG10735.1 hypothetical protein DQ04_03361070 [Trypanosoma grayi]